MGYRSDVVCIIYPNGESINKTEKYALLKTLLATTFKDVSVAWGSKMEWLDADCILEFDIPDVKWYGSYAEVKDFEDMRERIEAEEFEGIAIEFIRVGEESDDIDQHHSVTGEYYLRTETSIVRGHR
jgi:hypothetical protein